MGFMKLSAWLFLAALPILAADLGDLKTVYILPMSNGLDQYLAIQLVSGVVMQVVTDPQKADAILTDHIGAAFEQKMDELYGPKVKEADKDKDKDKDNAGDTFKSPVTAISRGRGAIFLVDHKTHDVVWSVYEKPKNTTPDELSRTAQKIAQKLEKARKGK